MAQGRSVQAAISNLTKRMPPPKSPKEADVDWNRLESALGFSYPASFKEFIAVYGSSTWCDHAVPVYTTAESDKEVQKFIALMEEKVARLGDITTYVFDKEGETEDIELPLFPEKGGLFAFMNDYGGSFYCWETKGRNPEKWPVVCCFPAGQLLFIKNLTVPQMFLEWFEKSPRMVDLWGNIDDLKPERIKLS